jgi:hypothetical protein
MRMRSFLRQAAALSDQRRGRRKQQLYDPDGRAGTLGELLDAGAAG